MFLFHVLSSSFSDLSLGVYMMKLFEKEHSVFSQLEPQLTREGITLDLEEFLSNMNEYDALDKAMEAHTDLVDIKSTLLDNRQDINNASIRLYNRSVETILSNLGVDYEEHKLSLESLTESSVEVHYKAISMEGVIGDLWEKIKAMFRRIFEGIRKFYKDHITKTGRVRKGLVKMRKLLSSTKNDAKALEAKNVPSSMSRHFKSFEKVDGKSLSSLSETAWLAEDVLTSVTKKAESFVRADLPKPEKLKKDLDKIANVRTKREDGTMSEKLLSKVVGEGDRDEISSAKSLGSRSDREQMKGFGTEVIDDLKKLIDKPVSGGKSWSSVENDGDGAIDIDTTEKDADTKSVVILDRETLLDSIETSIEILDKGDAARSAYQKVNDEVMKRFDALERLVKSFDTSDEEEGKKKEVQAEFKQAMEDNKVFLKSFNGASKELFKITLGACEASLDYAKVCIKYYG